VDANIYNNIFTVYKHRLPVRLRYGFETINIKSSLMVKLSITIITKLCDIDNLFSLHLCAHVCVNLYESAVGITAVNGGQGLNSERSVFHFSCILASMTHDLDWMPSSEGCHCVLTTALLGTDS